MGLTPARRVPTLDNLERAGDYTGPHPIVILLVSFIILGKYTSFSNMFYSILKEEREA
jgi:hypothetical protein